MSSTRMATTVCARSWTPSPRTCSWITTSNRRYAPCSLSSARQCQPRGYFDSWRNLMAGQLDRREALEAETAERGVAVPDHEHYDTWRDVIDEAVDRCEGMLADRGNYGIHLDCIALREESLGSALSRVREVLKDDDRHLAATLAGQREGESLRMREERIARLLDDPERLRSCNNGAPGAGPESSSKRAAVGACESSG